LGDRWASLTHPVPDEAEEEDDDDEDADADADADADSALTPSSTAGNAITATIQQTIRAILMSPTPTRLAIRY
jgi:hypothetical protein